MAVNAIALTTVTNFETRHGVATGVDTSLIEQAINAATRWIEGQCDRKLKARNYNGFGTAFEHKTSTTGDTVPSEDYIYIDGDPDAIGNHGMGVIYLPAFPILTPSGDNTKNRIKHKNAIAFKLEELVSRDESGETWQELTNNVDYVLTQDTGRIGLEFFMTRGTKNYRITATLGFSDIDAQPYVEPDLQDLCLYIAGKLYREDMDKTSDRQGSSSSDLIALSEDKYVQATLAQYARL